jgi:hypothetical protein
VASCSTDPRWHSVLNLSDNCRLAHRRACGRSAEWAGRKWQPTVVGRNNTLWCGSNTPRLCSRSARFLSRPAHRLLRCVTVFLSL